MINQFSAVSFVGFNFNVYFCTEIFKNISKYDKSVFTYTGHTEQK